jgi:hypothetical protein
MTRTLRNEISLWLTYGACYNPAERKEIMSINYTVTISINYTTIYLQNTRYWLTSAGCEAYSPGLYCLCIKPRTSYLWCGAGFINSFLCIKLYPSYLSQHARLRLEVRIIAHYKTAYFLWGRGIQTLVHRLHVPLISFLCSPQRRQDRDNSVHNFTPHQIIW